ncbi:immunoglobulin superfamily member 10 [Mixophyes fleayi]|uniref:immunoglobulin superfamily member 10 n=1 Tax=Mixophyes fleayi TaxID=3061075 RepID=UPI003F4E20C3
MQPIGRSDSCLPGYLIILWLSVLPDNSMACPKPCACYVQTEVHCTFRYLNVIPKQIQADVERINLGYNSLGKLTESDFSGLQKLELLMLHSNEIQTIHENAFKDLSSLQVLKMSYNKVKTLHKNTFSGLKSMVRLHMDHNKLEFLAPESFYGLTSLKLVHLEGNTLRQLHTDTFVTLRYIQIFKTSSIKHIYLSDNQLSSLPKDMFLYLNELEGLYIYGNFWSCDCNLQWLTEWGQKSKDVIKCKRDRSGQQCPLCFSPKKNKGKSLYEISSQDLACVKPTIDNIFKVKNVTTPEEGSFTAISAKDLAPPIGSLILNMTDQSGNEANLECSVHRPTKLSQITLDRKEEYTIMRTTFSSFLICNIDYDYIQKLWGILAMYSDSPMKLKRDLLLTKTPFISYKYKQVGSGDDTFTDIEAELRAEPNWLMQDLVTLQLDRTATTLSTLHIRYFTDIYVTIPNSVENPRKNSWVMIHKSNQTQTEYAAIIGETVEMHCQVVGEPAPNIEWLLPDGSKIKAPYMSKEGRITITENGKFILKAADSFDSGVYHCIATNDGDADVLTFRITVVSTEVEEEAVNGAELLVNNGDMLYLPCGSKGVPDASVSWILPDHSVLHEASRNKLIFSNGTLKIQDITQRERGYFRCLAANQYGLDVLTHRVMVKDRKMLHKKIQLDQIEDRNGEGSGNEDIKENNHSVTGKAIGYKKFPATRVATKPDGQGNEKTLLQRRNRINQRLRGYRRQFSQGTRRIDPQRWTEILQKTKQNSINNKILTQVIDSSPKEESEVERESGEVEEPSGEELLPVDEKFLVISEKYSSVTMLNAIPTVPAVTDSNTPLRTTKAISVTPTKNIIDKDKLDMPKINTDMIVSSPELTTSEYLTTVTNPHYSDTMPHTTTIYSSVKPTTLSTLNTSVVAIPEPPLPTGMQYLTSRHVTTNSILKYSITLPGRLKSDSHDYTTAFNSLTATPQIVITSPTAISSPRYTTTKDLPTTSTTAPSEFHYTAQNNITEAATMENELQVTAQFDIANPVTTSGYLYSLSEDVITSPPSEMSFISSTPPNVITNPTTASSDFSATPRNVFSHPPTTSSYLRVTSQSILSKSQLLVKLFPPSTSPTTGSPLFSSEPPVTHKDISNTPTSPKQFILTGIPNSDISFATPNTKRKMTQQNIASTPQSITGNFVLGNLPTTYGKYNLPLSTSEHGSENLSENQLSTQTQLQDTKIPQYSVARGEVEEGNVISIDSSTKSSTKLFLSQTEIGPIYFHSTQKIISPGLPAGSTIITHQQIQIVKDVTPLVPTLRRYGRRKINGRRRIIRPDRIPNVRAHQFKFGKLDNSEVTTAQTTVSQINKQKQLSYSTIPSSTYVPLPTKVSSITAPETLDGKQSTTQVTTRFKTIDNTEIATNAYVTSQPMTQKIPQISTVGMYVLDKIQVGERHTKDVATHIPTTSHVVGNEESLRSTSAQSTTKPRPASKIIRRKIPWHRLFANSQIMHREILKKLRISTQLLSAITTPLPSQPAVSKSYTTTTVSNLSTDSNSKANTNTPLVMAESTLHINPMNSKPTSTTVHPTSAKLATTVIQLTTAKATAITVYPASAKAATSAKMATTAVYPTSAKIAPIEGYPASAKAATTVVYPTSPSLAITVIQPTNSNAAAYSASTIVETTSKDLNFISDKSAMSTTPTPVPSVTADSIGRQRFLKRKRLRTKNIMRTSELQNIWRSTNAKMSTTPPEKTTKAHTITPTPKPAVTGAQTTRMFDLENNIPQTTVKKHFWSNTSKAPKMSLQPSHTMNGINTLTTPYRETYDNNYITTSDQALNRKNHFKQQFVTTHKAKTSSSYKPDTITSRPSLLSVTAKIIASATDLSPIMSPSTVQPPAVSGKKMSHTVDNRPDPKAPQRNVHVIARVPSVLNKPAQYNPSSTTAQHIGKKTSDQTTEIPSNNIGSKPRIMGGRAASFTVLANSDAFIPCEATGNPAPNILWTKVSSGTFVSKARRGNKMEVFTNGTLSITSASVQDRGQYLCVANNQYGSDRLLVTLSVITYPPRIIQGRSREITIHSGSSINVKCQAEGRPFPTITWILANETIASEKSDNNHKVFVHSDGTLTIREVTIYDRGIYKCLATNIAGADTFTVKIQVIAAPPVILEDKRQTVLVHPGENVKLHCTAKGNPHPSVHWVAFDGTKVKPLHYVNAKLFLFSNGTLYIRNAASSDNGNYECIATSSTGSERRVVNLKVEQSDTIPKIIQASPKSTEMNFGDTLMLNCSATGEPNPKIIWRLPSKAVVDQWHRMGSRIQVFPNGTLIVQSVNEKDAGDYLCVARNKMGDDVILMKVSITMKPAKIVQKQHLSKQVPYGKDFKVDCKASGSPLPEISWSLPDGTVINNILQADDSGRRKRRYVLFDNGTLYLNKVGMSEEGDYTCYAENTLGRDEMKVHISVVTAAPRIKLNPKTKFQARAGASTVLDCEAIGEPKPKIFWLLPSSDMIAMSHDRYILHDNGSLSITKVKLIDAGEYMCVARNPAGDDTRLLKLDVHSTPPVINGLYTNKTIIKDSALKHSRKLIHCSAEGTPPLQIMWIMPDNIYLTAPYHGSRIVVHKNGTLEIRNVRPSDTADFTCVARNDGGESMLVVQLEVLEVLRRPMFKNPFNEKIIAKPGKMAILNCFADGNPTPEIIWLLPNGTRFLNGQGYAKYYAGTNGTFIIYSPSKDDAGKYRCAARNKVGYIEKLIVLEVGQKPNILTHPKGPIKNIFGETLSLHCLSDGIPKPRVIWTLPSGFVIDRSSVNGKYLLLENGTLVIQETTIHDRGNYLCKAKNNAGEASISVPVMIVAYPPRITSKPPQNIHTRAGSPVHFNCMAIGIPKPEITWELPDLSVLTTASKGRPMGTELLHPQGTLVVQKPKSSDSGMYRCIAKNPLGTDSSLTYLKVI